MSQPSMIFSDVFRRADKDDNGSLSPEEFYGCFSDGILSLDNFSAMFTKADRDADGGISVDELVAFFEDEGRAFAGFFEAIENVNKQFLVAAQEIGKRYGSSSDIDKFKQRFFLQEGATQLEALAVVAKDSLNGLRLQSGGKPRIKRQSSDRGISDARSNEDLARKVTDQVVGRLGDVLNSHSDSVASLQQSVDILQSRIAQMEVQRSNFAHSASPPPPPFSGPGAPTAPVTAAAPAPAPVVYPDDPKALQQRVFNSGGRSGASEAFFDVRQANTQLLKVVASLYQKGSLSEEQRKNLKIMILLNETPAEVMDVARHFLSVQTLSSSDVNSEFEQVVFATVRRLGLL